jgi:hypothetical protein
MAVTDFVKLGIEGTLFYNADYDADENIVANWVELGYITDISFDEDPNNYEYYNKYTLQPAKRGRPTNSGSIGQMFTNYADSIFKLAKEGNAVAFRIDIADNGTGPVTEQFYVSTVNLKKRSYKPGNLNESGEQSVSVDFSYASSKFYQPA